ncbi:hypothetical protein ACLOAV_004452 [Pseudogymnoascus australis]
MAERQTGSRGWTEAEQKQWKTISDVNDAMIKLLRHHCKRTEFDEYFQSEDLDRSNELNSDDYEYVAISVNIIEKGVLSGIDAKNFGVITPYLAQIHVYEQAFVDCTRRTPTLATIFERQGWGGFRETHGLSYHRKKAAIALPPTALL